jgi:hypothetical protein
LGTFRFEHKGTPTRLEPPAVRAVHKLASQAPMEGAMFVAVEAEVTSVPEWAVGVILFGRHGKITTALAFQRIYDTSDTKVYVYSDPLPCTENPAGMAAPSIGDSVQIAWVDRYGRKSSLSNEATVSQ